MLNELRSIARYLQHFHAAPVRHLLLLCPLLASCSGAAHYVVRDPEGGLIALDGDGGAAMGEAQRLMREHCGGQGFRVTADGVYTVAMREEQVITGEESVQRLADDQSLRTSAVLPGMSGSAMPQGGQASVSNADGIQPFDMARNGATPRIPTPVRERRVEYECNVEDE